MRRMRRRTTPINYRDENGTVTPWLTVCPNDQTDLVPCSVPCCPFDCVVSAWGEWSPCVDGVKSRSRLIEIYPSCGGARCPECLVEKDVCYSEPIPGECEFGEACEEGWSDETTTPASVVV
jgi:hypothetical protein